MLLYLNYPSWIHPEIFPGVKFLGLIRWYGLMYCFAFLTAYFILKKVAKDGETTDAQFLTASYNYEPSTEKEKIITQETTKLPITYDGIALIVALVIVVGALTFVAIRMKKINKDEQK